ncbi:MAG: hypothetical protein DSY43_00005 [Gammaproteobacteria bacterium]|nr:MAG: hypothetical protein DSY43_00005 [Gammaproteobacteria bacterium]
MIIFLQFHLTADVEPDIPEVIKHLTEHNCSVKPGPFWIRFQNQLAVKLRKHEEPVSVILLLIFPSSV